MLPHEAAILGSGKKHQQDNAIPKLLKGSVPTYPSSEGPECESELNDWNAHTEQSLAKPTMQTHR